MQQSFLNVIELNYSRKILLSTIFSALKCSNCFPVNKCRMLPQCLFGFEIFTTNSALEIFSHDLATFKMSCYSRFSNKCFCTMCTLECPCIGMHVRMCHIMILIHEPLTTYSTKKFEILFVMVNVQFIVINACKFLVAVRFGTRYLWYDLFILKAKLIKFSQQLFPVTLC